MNSVNAGSNMKIEISNENGIVRSAVVYGDANCLNLIIEDGGSAINLHPVIKIDSITWLYYTEEDNYDSVSLIPENNLEQQIITRVPFYSTNSGKTHLAMIHEKHTRMQ